jgi:hypothetical protein
MILFYNINLTLLNPLQLLPWASFILALIPSVKLVITRYDPLEIKSVAFSGLTVIRDAGTLNAKNLEKLSSTFIIELHNKLNASIIIYSAWVEVLSIKQSMFNLHPYTQLKKFPLDMEMPSTIHPKGCASLEVSWDLIGSIFSACDEVSKIVGNDFILRVGAKHQFGIKYSRTFDDKDFASFLIPIRIEYSHEAAKTIVNDAIQNKDTPESLLQKMIEFDKSLFTITNESIILMGLYEFLEKYHPDSEFASRFKQKYKQKYDYEKKNLEGLLRVAKEEFQKHETKSRK